LVMLSLSDTDTAAFVIQHCHCHCRPTSQGLSSFTKSGPSLLINAATRDCCTTDCMALVHALLNTANDAGQGRGSAARIEHVANSTTHGKLLGLQHSSRILPLLDYHLELAEKHATNSTTRHVSLTAHLVRPHPPLIPCSKHP